MGNETFRLSLQAFDNLNPTQTSRVEASANSHKLIAALAERGYFVSLGMNQGTFRGAPIEILVEGAGDIKGDFEKLNKEFRLPYSYEKSQVNPTVNHDRNSGSLKISLDIQALSDLVKNRSGIQVQRDLCGEFQVLYESDSMSISYFVIKGKAREHKHERMEEVYIIQKGMGVIHIDGESRRVGAGDVITIPKGKFHYLESINRGRSRALELFVVTHPKYDVSDVIER